MNKKTFSEQAPPRPAGEADSAPPDILAGFKGTLTAGKDSEGGKNG